MDDENEIEWCHDQREAQREAQLDHWYLPTLRIIMARLAPTSRTVRTMRPVAMPPIRTRVLMRTVLRLTTIIRFNGKLLTDESSVLSILQLLMAMTILSLSCWPTESMLTRAVPKLVAFCSSVIV